MEVLSGEANSRHSQVMVSLNMMHTQINWPIRTAINDRVFPHIQDIVCSLPLRERDIGTGTSSCDKGLGAKSDGSNTNLSKKDSRSAFDFREEADLNLHT